MDKSVKFLATFGVVAIVLYGLWLSADAFTPREERPVMKIAISSTNQNWSCEIIDDDTEVTQEIVRTTDYTGTTMKYYATGEHLKIGGAAVTVPKVVYLTNHGYNISFPRYYHYDLSTGNWYSFQDQDWYFDNDV